MKSESTVILRLVDACDFRKRSFPKTLRDDPAYSERALPILRGESGQIAPMVFGPGGGED